MDDKIICIACSIFKSDLDKIVAMNHFMMEMVYIDSMFHMHPGKLKKILYDKTGEYDDRNIILLYGDCQPDMLNLEERKNVYRSPGINCCNIVLENKRYKELQRNGAFILMDEWVMRWKEVFLKELGFKTREISRMFMQEMHTKLVYIDAGNIEIPYNELKDISEYCGLPYEVEKSDINTLYNIFVDARNYFKNENR